jgi:hypothetical protein
MQNTKIINLLSRFLPDEWRQFRRFVQSPYFNTNDKVTKLCEYLHQNQKKPAKLQRTVVFAHLFGNETYKEIKLQQYASLLVGLVEQFWQHQSLQADTPNALLRLSQAYEQHQLPHYADSTLEALQKVAQTTDSTTQAYYQLQSALLLHNRIEEQQQREQEPNLQAISDTLDTYYLLNKLIYYAKSLNYLRFEQYNYDFSMLPLVLQATEHIANRPHLTLKLHYYALQILRTDNTEHENHFNQLKNGLMQHYAQINRPEAQELFAMVHNYCVRQLNKGEPKYWRELFEIYRFEVAHELISKTETMPHSQYRNLITIALHLNEWEWARKFIHDFKNTVGDEVFSVNLARFYFTKKQYDKTIDLLSQSQYTDVLMLLDAKSLLLRSYFELFVLHQKHDWDSTEQLDSFIVSFTALLQRRRNELKQHLPFYLNLVGFVRRLVKCHELPDATELHQLKTEISTCVAVAEKPWLLEKCNLVLV